MTDNKLSSFDKIFNTNKFADCVLLVGKSFRGKSWLLRYIVQTKYRQGHFKFGIVFSKTLFNGDYDWLPDKAKIEGYDENTLMRYFNNIKQIKLSGKEPPQSFIIFDDLVAVLDSKSKFFTNFLATHRHLNIHVFIAVQYLLGTVTPIFREQISISIMFLSKTRRTLEALYESFGGLFQSYKEFKDYFINGTSKQPYIAMVYQNSEDDIKKNYTFIRAPANFTTEQIEF